VSLEFRHAIRDALAEELERDERVVFFGEDVAAAGGVFAVTGGLAERFGPTRVFDTPISELALAGAAFGSAVTGLRPVIEIMFGDFMTLAMDSLVNQASKFWYLSNEQASVPLVVRCAVGAGGRFGAIHSQTPATWFLGVPGLKVACPAFPGDAKALLKGAIRDNNPVVFLEHKRLYSLREEVRGQRSEEEEVRGQRSEEEEVRGQRSEVIGLGSGRVVRSGRDLTVAAVMKGVHDALAAAELLAGDGIECEVIDLRSLRPLDLGTVLESVGRTNRLLVVEEGPRLGGFGSGLVGAVAEAALEDLDDAWVLATPETPIPYSPPLEDAFLPGAEAIASSIRARLGVGEAALR
jgi:acetoin:2,6-dichlorophenolindophenol oxidoreductase subunit beta